MQGDPCRTHRGSYADRSGTESVELRLYLNGKCYRARARVRATAYKGTRHSSSSQESPVTARTIITYASTRFRAGLERCLAFTIVTCRARDRRRACTILVGAVMKQMYDRSGSSAHLRLTQPLDVRHGTLPIASVLVPVKLLKTFPR